MALKYAIKKESWYGFDEKKINKYYDGGLSFVAEFTINNEYSPVAVYKCAKPNRKLGHKDYVLFQANYNPFTGKRLSGIVRGMDRAEMKKYLTHSAVKCPECSLVLYSINRHHFHKCGCANETFVDGGREYCRYGGVKLPIVGTINFEKGTFRKARK